tara:strand:- start:790 stop:957 length:168 start_codon:yes stop_codon:yes gene_type:complete
MHVQKTHTFQRCLAIEWYEQTAGWAVTAAPVVWTQNETFSSKKALHFLEQMLDGH